MAKKISIENAAKEYIELKALEKAREARLAELKDVLLPALRAAENQRLELAGFEFSVVEFEKEFFSLTKAREVIDGRTLAPYITKSNVVQIRTAWRGGEAA